MNAMNLINHERNEVIKEENKQRYSSYYHCLQEVSSSSRIKWNLK